MNHLTEAQLNDLVDAEIRHEKSQAENSLARAHLDACKACRAELEAIRSVVLDVGALPCGISPARDLLSGIHEAIGTVPSAARDSQPAIDGVPQRAQPEPWRRQSLWAMRWPLAAAALLLIVATAVITNALSEPAVAPPSASLPPDGTVRPIGQETRAIEQKYESAIAELEQLVEAQRASLSPATLQLLQHNLRVIDRAIRESRAALEQDPNSELVNDLLRSAYERKLDLLRRATAVTT